MKAHISFTTGQFYYYDVKLLTSKKATGGMKQAMAKMWKTRV